MQDNYKKKKQEIDKWVNINNNIKNYLINEDLFYIK